MNLAPSGTMSGVDSGRALSHLAVRARSAPFAIEQRAGACAVERLRSALIAGLSVSSIVLAFASMIERLASCKSDATGGTQCRVWRALTAKHALKERGGLDELACAREACGFANDVLIQHRLHRVLSARAALTAGLACKAPSTETEAMVARASSGVTSWAMRGKAQNIDVQHLTGSPHRFEILAAVVPQTEVQTFRAVDCFDDVCVTFELVADCRSNEVGTVRVEPFLNH